MVFDLLNALVPSPILLASTDAMMTLAYCMTEQLSTASCLFIHIAELIHTPFLVRNCIYRSYFAKCIRFGQSCDYIIGQAQ